MKQISISENIVTNYKEALIYAYAFLNTKILYKPEATLLTDEELGKPKNGLLINDKIVTHSFGGLDNNIPSWKEFYNVVGINKTKPLICVAGCDSDDKKRITLLVLPLRESNDHSINKNNYLLLSIDDSINNKQLDFILQSIQSNYEIFKNLYQHD
jgi:hypothetical protein